MFTVWLHYRVWSVLNSQNTRHIHIQMGKCKNKRNHTHYRAKYNGLSDHGLSHPEWVETFKAFSMSSYAFFFSEWGGWCCPLLQKRRQTLEEQRFSYSSARTQSQTYHLLKQMETYALCAFVLIISAYKSTKAHSTKRDISSFPPLLDIYLHL